MDKVIKAVGVSVLFFVMIALLAVIGAYPTKWMVNYLFTDSLRLSVFGVAQIGFVRALVLNIFCGWLIKTQVNQK